MRRSRSIVRPAALVVLLLASAPFALAEETRISVRVLSKDAKFIGTSMGGVAVTVQDADTGEILAAGETSGSTGDTDRIMREPRQRGGELSTDGSARWDGVLDLAAPRRIRITARGPLAQAQSANQVEVVQWVVPGGHLDGGDGVLLEMPGFIVDILAPPAHFRLGDAPQEVEIRVNLTMMCGCPTSPGGLWDSDRYQLRALIERDGRPVAELPLAYAGATSQFAARWTAAEPGAYEVLVWAYDPSNGNTGLDRTTFLISGG